MLLVLAAFLGLARPAATDEPEAPAEPRTLEQLLLDWEVVSRRVDERGWEEQRQVLFAIADLDTREAQAALKGLRDRHGRGDWRRTRHILAAMLRHATPGELEEVVRWVEVRRDPFLLEHLGEALTHVREEETRRHLRGEALRRATPVVKAQMARSLGLARDRAAVPALLLLLRNVIVRVRVEALDALARIGDPSAASVVSLFLRDDDRRVRAAAAETLGALGEKQVVPHLLRLLEDEEKRVVEAAALALGRLESPAAIPALLDLLEAQIEDDVRLADAARRALEAISGIPFGMAPERWRAWWNEVKDRPWKRVERAPASGGGHTVAESRYYGFTLRSSRIVFLLDVSRSMGWHDRLKHAKAELIRTLEKLPPHTQFRIVAFSDGVEAWPRTEGLVPASSAKVAGAVRFVKKLKPLNGTNTWAALQSGLATEEADTLFLLSDGHPSVGDVVDPDLILARLRTANRYRRVRIHCIALLVGGPPPSYGVVENRRRAESFMERLAEDHDGQIEVVE